MTSPLYSYGPIYGAELNANISGKEFANPDGTSPEADGAYGGGSIITSQNLLMGMWTVTNEVSGLPVQGAQLRAVTDFPDDINNVFGFDVVAAFDPKFSNSRTSFEATISPEGQFSGDIMAVLNPPPSFKETLARALSLTAGGAGIFGVEGSVNKSLLDSVLPKVSIYERGLSAFISPPSDPVTWSMGSALANFAVGGGLLTLLKTSGANGDYPTFITNDGSASSILEVQTALDSGDFFIPFTVSWDESAITDGLLLRVEWPDSIIR